MHVRSLPLGRTALSISILMLLFLGTDVNAQPANDDLADAVEITSFPFEDQTTNVEATGEAGEASSECSSSSGASNSVWWVHTAEENGILHVDTDGSNFDLVLSIWTGSDHPLTEVNCSDDSPEAISRSISTGETYYIRVSGYSDSGEGDISLSVILDPPLPNDDLANATEIAALPFTDTGSTVGATLEPDEEIASCGYESPQEGSVWWKYTAEEAGRLRIDTDDSDFDLVLSVWTGDDHPLNDVGCTDSDSGGILEVSPGDTYFIRISGYDKDDVGEISLEVSLELPEPIYVDIDASGTEDGSSWEDAYTDLHDALADDGPEIWMAAGTYSSGDTPFELEDGSKIYGGFSGTEEARGERDFSTHETLLTGLADHVFYARGVGGTTILDGLTISGGTADGDDDGENGAGLYCDGRAIYGTFSGGCSITIRNAIFRDNQADGRGGAIYLDGRDDGSASASLRDVTFLNNSAATAGGAIYVNAEGGIGSPDVVNAVFAENSAGLGGAVDIWAGLLGSATPTFTNVLFVDNTALAGGGAVHNSNAAGMGGTAEPVFTNTTFYGNAAPEGGAIHNYGLTQVGGIVEGEAVIYLQNSIVWGNTDDQGGINNFGTRGDGRAEIVSSLIERGCPMFFECETVIDDDPSFANESNATGPDGIFRTDDDGLRLGEASPAIGAGDETLNTTEVDLAGGARVVDGDIDLGPYESGETSVSAPEEELPHGLVLHGNYPNPFTRTTTIRYELPEPAQVTVDVYDVLGRRVRALLDTHQEAGENEVAFDASELPAGLYVIRVRVGEVVRTHQMVHVK